MESNALELKWEWPAGREIESAVLVKVQAIEPASKGLFGIRASASFADSLPEATDVSIVVDDRDVRYPGRSATIRLPGVEARKLVAGHWAAIGLLAEGRVCACVEVAPKVPIEELRRWISGWKCTG